MPVGGNIGDNAGVGDAANLVGDAVNVDAGDLATADVDAAADTDADAGTTMTAAGIFNPLTLGVGADTLTLAGGGGSAGGGCLSFCQRPT